MRFGWLIALAALAACHAPASDSARLTINDPYWDRVNVEVVITKLGDCDSRADGFISEKQLVMRKNKTETFEVPSGANLCWRHDRNPNTPVAGAWSGWTKATLFPGKSAETDL